MKKFSEFFQDPDGAMSATRLTLIMWSTGLLICVMWLTFVERAFPHVEPSLITLFGIVVSGKVVQSFSENMAPNDPSNIPPKPTP